MVQDQPARRFFCARACVLVAPPIIHPSSLLARIVIIVNHHHPAIILVPARPGPGRRGPVLCGAGCSRWLLASLGCMYMLGDPSIQTRPESEPSRRPSGALWRYLRRLARDACYAMDATPVPTDIALPHAGAGPGGLLTHYCQCWPSGHTCFGSLATYCICPPVMYYLPLHASSLINCPLVVAASPPSPTQAGHVPHLRWDSRAPAGLKQPTAPAWRSGEFDDDSTADATAPAFCRLLRRPRRRRRWMRGMVICLPSQQATGTPGDVETTPGDFPGFIWHGMVNLERYWWQSPATPATYPPGTRWIRATAKATFSLIASLNILFWISLAFVGLPSWAPPPPGLAGPGQRHAYHASHARLARKAIGTHMHASEPWPVRGSEVVSST